MDFSGYFEPITSEIVINQPDQDYRKVKAVSSSMIKDARQSERKFKYNLISPFEATPAMRMGQWIHSAILTPDIFQSEICIVDIGSRNTKVFKDAVAAHPDKKHFLLIDEYAQVQAIVQSVYSSALVRSVLQGHPEVSMYYSGHESGMNLKGRADLIGEDYILDIKTIIDCSEASIQKTITNYGYHIQAAHYADLCAKLHQPKDFYLILFIEKEPPYDWKIVQLDDASLEKGLSHRDKGIERIKDWVQNGKTWEQVEQKELILSGISSWGFTEEF